jgi:hypothetical protein
MDEWNPAIKPVPGMAYKVTEQEIEDYMKSLKLPEKQDKYDSVDKPKHYMLFEPYEISHRADAALGLEVRNVIDKLTQKFEMSPTGHSYMYVSDYVQMMQYLMRFMDKNGTEDLKKARWYLDRMIESY